MMVGLKRISTTLGLLAVFASASRAQAVVPSANQGTADAVAQALRASQSLSGCRIAIEARNGQATLSGTVATPEQKAEALARAQVVPGVTLVLDGISVAGDPRVVPVQYQVARGFHRNRGMMGGDDVVYDGIGGGAAAAAVSAEAANGPLPEGPAGSTSAVQVAAGTYPNYAWPSYAPYPNFSAVGYPLIYPWQAWPNIGPFYPYPEPPLDWRAVTARYKDGTWQVQFRRGYTRPFIFVWPFADILNRNY